eukprot:8297366-Pyramimonas_sp.AAC.1
MRPTCTHQVAARRGSVSAEHGIGAMKPGALHYSKSEAAISVMRLIKHALDPKGIMVRHNNNNNNKREFHS